jgi:type II secretory pathway pseudopilin PulG
MAEKLQENKLKRGFIITTEILICLAMVLISILGIMIVTSVSRRKAEERAVQRAADLRMLKNALENYKLYYGFYPGTGLDVYNIAKRYSKVTYPDERWNECDKSNNWIPNLTINLPHDPSNSCKNKENPYPRYEYVSDGRDYKILSYKLSGEICDRKEYKELIDPARPCNRYDASWAIYSWGAKDW